MQLQPKSRCGGAKRERKSDASATCLAPPFYAFRRPCWRQTAETTRLLSALQDLSRDDGYLHLRVNLKRMIDAGALQPGPRLLFVDYRQVPSPLDDAQGTSCPFAWFLRTPDVRHVRLFCLSLSSHAAHLLRRPIRTEPRVRLWGDLLPDGRVLHEGTTHATLNGFRKAAILRCRASLGLGVVMGISAHVFLLHGGEERLAREVFKDWLISIGDARGAEGLGDPQAEEGSGHDSDEDYRMYGKPRKKRVRKRKARFEHLSGLAIAAVDKRLQMSSRSLRSHAYVFLGDGQPQMARLCKSRLRASSCPPHGRLHAQKAAVPGTRGFPPLSLDITSDLKALLQAGTIQPGERCLVTTYRCAFSPAPLAIQRGTE